MAILSDFNKAYHPGDPMYGAGATATGSTAFVLNTDAKTATTAWDDPYYQINGTPGQEGNIRPVVVPSMGLHLELNVAWRGTNPSEDLPVIALYGEVPWNNDTQTRYWPKDIDSNLSGSTDNGTTADDSAFWVPLVNYDLYEIQTDPEDVDATNLIALHSSNITALDSGDGSPGIKMGVPRRVYLGGVTRVICTIETAADNADAAVIVGRFIG